MIHLPPCVLVNTCEKGIHRSVPAKLERKDNEDDRIVSSHGYQTADREFTCRAALGNSETPVNTKLSLRQVCILKESAHQLSRLAV